MASQASPLCDEQPWLILQSKYRWHLVEAGYRMAAEIFPFALREAREIRGRDDGSLEPCGQLLETRGEVHRRSDASEIEPVARTDIAVHHLA